MNLWVPGFHWATSDGKSRISPGRFCFLLYQAPSRGDFSTAISSSSSSSTSSAAGEKEGGGGWSVEGSWRSWTEPSRHMENMQSTTAVADLLCRSTPGSRSAPSRSAAACAASGTPAASPRALSPWQTRCGNTETRRGKSSS